MSIYFASSTAALLVCGPFAKVKQVIISKVQTFFVFLFFPPFTSSLMMWGDERTSAGFQPGPYWFEIFGSVFQLLGIFLLFTPFKFRLRPPLVSITVAFSLVLICFLVEPVHAAEQVLVSSSFKMGIVAIFVLFFKPSTRLRPEDLGFLFTAFVVGYFLQVCLYVGFGQLPSHSVSGGLIRFNGITNDSLSTGFVLSLLVPWAVRTKFRVFKVFALVLMSVLSGSLFAIGVVLIITSLYSIFVKAYFFVIMLFSVLFVAVLLFYRVIADIVAVKLYSIITHLRFFLDLGNIDVGQPSQDCSVEFCESFLEASLSLSPLYTIAMYGILLSFARLLVFKDRTMADFDKHSVLALAFALLIGTLVHPVPLIPFAFPMFLIFSVLCRRHKGLIVQKHEALSYRSTVNALSQ